MKVMFNGIIEKKSKGCNCRNKGNSEYGFTTTKMYILPSGISKTFTVGKEESVSDSDGRFLLSYQAVDVNGSQRSVFTKVE